MISFPFSNVSELWNNVRTVFGNFSVTDKAAIEAVWDGYKSVLTELSRNLDQVHNSMFINDIEAVWDSRHDFYDVIYATTDDDMYGSLINCNTVDDSSVSGYTATDGSGFIGFPLNAYILRVTDVKNIYWQDASNEWVEEDLMEGVDYIIHDLNTLLFLNSTNPFTLSLDYPNLYRTQIYIGKTESINPVLFSLWGARVGMTTKMFKDANYDTWTTTSGYDGYVDRANHYLEIIKALHYWSKQKPTLKAVRNAIGIAKGYPFSYNSGTLTKLSGTPHDQITIGSQTMYFESGNGVLEACSSGTIEQYEVIVDNWQLHDYTSNSGLIIENDDGYGVNTLNTVVFTEPTSISGVFGYDSTLYDESIDRFVGKHLFMKTVGV